MGWSCSSVHFWSSDHSAVLAAVRGAAKSTKGKGLLTPAPAARKRAAAAWVSLFPNDRMFSRSNVIDKMVRASGAPFVLVVSLCDDDVLCYTLAKDGDVVDVFISCPDYYGECDKEDLDAKGDAKKFTGLLDAAKRKRLAKLIKPRLINGKEVGGETPVFESERLAALGALLGIDGVLGEYDGLSAGEKVPGINRPKELLRVG